MDATRDFCREHGIVIQAFAALGHAMEPNLLEEAIVVGIARRLGRTPAQVALAWLISLPGVVAIPGASSVEQLEFNVAAADLELSTENRDALTAAARAFRPVSVGRSLVDMARERLGR